MIRLPWYRKAQFVLVHLLSVPIQKLCYRLGGWEFGHSAAEISRILCRYSPLAGKRAVHLTDLHLDRYQPRHDDIIRTIAGSQPDWIFVTGDLLNEPQGLPHLFRFLSQLRNLAPVFVTLGNHDHFSGVPIPTFAEMADQYKIHLLINQVTFVPVEAGELEIVGLDDPSLHRADLRCIPPRMPNRFRVLLAHAPHVVDHLDGHHAIDLVLSGHSHGGQWCIPWVPPFWLPYGCRGRLSGEHRVRGHRLYVNRGLGWSILPIRFRCAPEILVIDWDKDSPPRPA